MYLSVFGTSKVFYDPPNEVGGSLCFCLVRPASVRPGGKKKYGLKTRFRGFWVYFGCFWRFRLLSVRPSGQWMGYVLCRELVLGVWGLEPETNLKWMNIYWSCAPPIFWTSVSTVGLSERGLNLGYLTCSLMAMCYVLCRELVLGVWGLEPETNLKWMNIYWSCAPPIFWTSVSTVGLSERGLNLGYLTCSLMAMCYVLCRELVLGVWGLEPETNLKWMNIYWSCAPPIFWTSISTVGLSERGLNLGYSTCSLMAMCYVLCRELVLGFWGLEPQTNLKWMNIYWSCAPPILDVRLDRRSVGEGSELR